jgi:hypothetical protein
MAKTQRLVLPKQDLQSMIASQATVGVTGSVLLFCAEATLALLSTDATMSVNGSGSIMIVSVRLLVDLISVNFCRSYNLPGMSMMDLWGPPPEKVKNF